MSQGEASSSSTEASPSWWERNHKTHERSRQSPGGLEDAATTAAVAAPTIDIEQGQASKSDGDDNDDDHYNDGVLLDYEDASSDSTEINRANNRKKTKLPDAIRKTLNRKEKIIGLKDAIGTSLTSLKAHRTDFLRQRNMSTDTIAAPNNIGNMTNRPLGSKMVTIEEKENQVRAQESRNPLRIMFLSNLAAFKVMIFYLITLETLIICALTTGITMYWYNVAKDHNSNPETSSDVSWNGSGMDFVILAFAVTSPIATAIGMTFTRRENALVMIAEMRSFSHHLYLAHSLWDWKEDGGRENCSFDFLEHCDAVLAQLVGIGDELSRFLTLPTTSRSRHRMTHSGRREAARTIEVAYGLLESMITQRMTRLSIYAERIKKVGLPSGEVSRIRQYERFLQNAIERLRMYKMYRSPQALRSFARIFTFLLPPFYAPTFAQLAIDVDSLAVGISFGIITSIGLTALFESLQVLEDPFVGYLALDGIDIKEELEVLLWSSLVKTRRVVFPEAMKFPEERRAALKDGSSFRDDGLSRKPSVIQVVSPTPALSALNSSRHNDTGRARSFGGTTLDQQTEGEEKGPSSYQSDVSFESMSSKGGQRRRNNDIEAAEFGHPILEDPEDEPFLRKTKFRGDGQLAHHERHRSTASTANMLGLVFRSNANLNQNTNTSASSPRHT